MSAQSARAIMVEPAHLAQEFHQMLKDFFQQFLDHLTFDTSALSANASAFVKAWRQKRWRTAADASVCCAALFATASLLVEHHYVYALDLIYYRVFEVSLIVYAALYLSARSRNRPIPLAIESIRQLIFVGFYLFWYWYAAHRNFGEAAVITGGPANILFMCFVTFLAPVSRRKVFWTTLAMLIASGIVVATSNEGIPAIWLYQVALSLTFSFLIRLVIDIQAIREAVLVLNLEEAKVAQAEAEAKAFRKELELGAAVQSLLLPNDRRGHIGGWEYLIDFRPLGAMSGDWFQVHHGRDADGEDFIVVAIGDVVGKGPSAALLTALIAGQWNDWKKEAKVTRDSLGNLVRRLHVATRETFNGEQNSSISLIAAKGRRCLIGSVGAPKWMHFDHKESRASKKQTNPISPLGVRGCEVTDRIIRVPDLTEQQFVEVVAEPGDFLIAYTDGVLESSKADRAFALALSSAGRQLDCGGVVELALRVGVERQLPDDRTTLIFRRSTARSTTAVA